ncbi:sigma 54 modulation/S30EA ribosomal C-terminal domain-containing protein [Lentzea sp. HUAS TT2]|uniref:sigma 54 modulation/S30EA ribosomal C-terminal domain-containing protein n=1 Tax=Lentzea sp. HUAS TT2 TaxID=3447454 RepID=UPI003F6EF298
MRDPARCTPEQAALTMDLTDYDIHLFVDAETGKDGAVYASARRVIALPGWWARRRARLDAMELPFRLFRNADTDPRRGVVPASRRSLRTYHPGYLVNAGESRPQWDFGPCWTLPDRSQDARVLPVTQERT